jgi:replicative DNA helicase
MNALEVPNDIELEQALLGAILMNNEAHHIVSGYFRAEYFYEQVHGEIYEAISRLIAAGKKADALTVRSQLPHELTPEITMQEYLAKLSGAAATVLNAADYAHILQDMAIRRGLISISDGIAHAAAQPSTEVSAEKQIEEAERHLFELQKTGTSMKGFRRFNHALTDAVEMTAAAYQRQGKLAGISSGLHSLDRLMGGLQNSDLVVLAGRPAMGKTALATNVAFHAANHYRAGENDKPDNGARVGFFSLEMSAPQLAMRILAEQTGVSSSDLRRGAIHESQFNKIVEASQHIEACPMHIDDRGGLNNAQVAATARRLKRREGLDLLIIDYLQLMAGSLRRNENRVQEMTEITTSLKALAKELDIPIIALSQLSRQVENRENKRPQLADLRESGSIEQDADVVLFVYRDEYYLQNKEPDENTADHMEWQGKMAAAAGKAEVIVSKNRHGPTGTIQLAFNPMLTRFHDLARDDQIPERAA